MMLTKPLLLAALLATAGCASYGAGGLLIAAPVAAPQTGALMPGVACVDAGAAMPTWQLDPAQHIAKLSNADLTVALPPAWRITQERPDLLVVSGPKEGLGPQAQFEVFVAPQCDSYDGMAVIRRVAIRALADRYKPAEIAAVWDGMSLPAKSIAATVNNDPRSVLELNLLMRDAEVSLALFYNVVGKTDTERVTLAGGCPRNEDPRRHCEAAYRTLVSSVKYVEPPPPAPASPVVAPAPAND